MTTYSDTETINAFFDALAAQDDARLDITQATITLDRLITRYGKDRYIADVMAAVGRVNGRCHTPLKMIFVERALDAGIKKATGYPADDGGTPERPAFNPDRDFPAAIALASFWQGLYPAGEREGRARAAAAIDHLKARQLNWRPPF